MFRGLATTLMLLGAALWPGASETDMLKHGAVSLHEHVKPKIRTAGAHLHHGGAVFTLAWMRPVIGSLSRIWPGFVMMSVFILFFRALARPSGVCSALHNILHRAVALLRSERVRNARTFMSRTGRDLGSGPALPQVAVQEIAVSARSSYRVLSTPR
mmetsp:Transcript_30411/g.56271  ORF Transcript_30411/g.56271 Transcript_30411/m.56271 type:complete len:157 (-) Transcript_30411:79-549(-)